MQQNAPLESGIASFLQNFGSTVAQGSTNEQKSALKAYLADKAEKGKDTRLDKNLNFKSSHPSGAKGGQDPKDKNFVSTFKTYQAAWKGALQNFINEHSDMSKNPQQAVAWNALSKDQKNQEISDAINDPNGELSSVKDQHDFVYNPDNITRFSKLNGIGQGSNATNAKPATALDLQAPPIVAPPAQGHTALPPQMRPTPQPQSRPAPVMAQAPAPNLKFPMAPATPEDIQGMTAKQPMVASLPGGPTGANAQTNTPIPGQGPSASQDEEAFG